MSKVIKVENLSKKYLIGHQSLKREKNLRVALQNSFNNFVSKFKHTFSKSISKNSPFKEFWALKDINYEVEQGDRIGIIGMNGAGKSTLLKILSRITEPTTGKITIRGRVASLLEVGTGFHGELTGRENIFLNGAVLGMKRDEIKRKFNEIVDFAGVEKFIDTPLKRYSSGMYVRLAFAVAAHLEPEILVVDEVLAVGDAEFQKKCLGKMEDISKSEGRTILFVSHNMAAIESLCKKVLVLQEGNKIFEGNTKDGIDLYLNMGLINSKTIFLEDRKDRIGNGLIKFTDISFFNNNNNIVNNLLSGNDYTIELKYNNCTMETFNNIIVSIEIYDERGNRLLLFRNDLTNDIININPGIGYIYCKIENFPLAIGTYYFSLYLSMNDVIIYDMVDKAGHVDVVGGDFFGTGKLGFPEHCRLLSKAIWK